MKPRTRWKGRSDHGSWFDAARWNQGVPTAQSRVLFDGAGAQTVTLDHASAQAGRLCVAHDALTLAQGVLDLSGGDAFPDVTVDEAASLTIAASAAIVTRGGVAVGQLTRDGGFSAGTLSVQGYLSASTVEDLAGTISVIAGATLDASGGLGLTPVQVPPGAPSAVLAVDGVVKAGMVSGIGTIMEAGAGANLTATALMLDTGTLSVAGGAIASLGAVELGNALVDMTAAISVTGRASTVTAGAITISNDANAALSVTAGGTLNAASINTASSSNNGVMIAAYGAGSSISAGTLAMGQAGDTDALSITQDASLTTGAGGLTIDFMALQLDSTATLSTPLLTCLAGTIGVLAHGGNVTLTSAIALGLDPLTETGRSTFTSAPAASLTITGAVAGQANTSLVTSGDIVLTNGANVLPAIGIQNGTLAIAATGAAGTATISFLGSSALTVLQIDPGVSLGNMIAGFAGSDAVDLQGFAFNANIMESLQGGTLTLNNGMAAVSLIFAGTYVQDQFALQADQHGGTLITFHP